MSMVISSPTPGKIFRIDINVGDTIEQDDNAFVIEIMKMETPVYSDFNGIVKTINVKIGDMVKQGDILAVIE